MGRGEDVSIEGVTGGKSLWLWNNSVSYRDADNRSLYMGSRCTNVKSLSLILYYNYLKWNYWGKWVKGPGDPFVHFVTSCESLVISK